MAQQQKQYVQCCNPRWVAAPHAQALMGSGFPLPERDLEQPAREGAAPSSGITRPAQPPPSGGPQPVSTGPVGTHLCGHSLGHVDFRQAQGCLSDITLSSPLINSSQASLLHQKAARLPPPTAMDAASWRRTPHTDIRHPAVPAKPPSGI